MPQNQSQQQPTSSGSGGPPHLPYSSTQTLPGSPMAGLVGPSGANAAPARPHCMSSPGVHEPHLRLVLGLFVPL